VGASAGEETGNLNLIFRDQFTQTGIIPGSSIRGRFRADMRLRRQQSLEAELMKVPGINAPAATERKIKISDNPQKEIPRLKWLEQIAKEKGIEVSKQIDESYWYGHEAVSGQTDGGTTEALVKFEYASLLWIPVFCPGQPVVWVSCPRLLRRYKQITGKTDEVPKPFIKSEGEPKVYPSSLREHRDLLFFSLGFLDNLEKTPKLKDWVPQESQIQPDNLVIVDDQDISIIHDMALYRQTRTKLENDVKKVENFFGFEALPEDSILIFPIAIKDSVPQYDKNSDTAQDGSDHWKPFENRTMRELYFGGLESIGCGRCQVTLSGEYFGGLTTN
jgi:CRISPR-associated protein Cmr4